MTFLLTKFLVIFVIFSAPLSLPIYGNEETSTWMTNKNFQTIADFYLWDQDLKNAEGVIVSSEDIFDGSIIYISRGKALDHFYKTIQPNISSQYILLTYICSYNPSLKKYYPLFNDPNLIAWVGHVHDERIFNFKKFHTTPLGIESKRSNSLYKKRKQGYLEKEILLYLNFNVKNSPKTKDRQVAFNTLAPLDFTVWSEKRSYEDYLDDLKKSKFVLCPGGFSFDSYRTWEVLLMGSIPVIKKHSQSHIYNDLPILLINDFDELTEEFLLEKYEEISTQYYNYDQLYIDYWKDYVYNLLRQEGYSRQ